jgi:hypothetical protein
MGVASRFVLAHKLDRLHAKPSIVRLFRVFAEQLGLVCLFEAKCEAPRNSVRVRLPDIALLSRESNRVKSDAPLKHLQFQRLPYSCGMTDHSAIFDSPFLVYAHVADLESE